MRSLLVPKRHPPPDGRSFLHYIWQAGHSSRGHFEYVSLSEATQQWRSASQAFDVAWKELHFIDRVS